MHGMFKYTPCVVPMTPEVLRMSLMTCTLCHPRSYKLTGEYFSKRFVASIWFHAYHILSKKCRWYFWDSAMFWMCSMRLFLFVCLCVGLRNTYGWLVEPMLEDGACMFRAVGEMCAKHACAPYTIARTVC